jgi:hypothetical protein
MLTQAINLNSTVGTSKDQQGVNLALSFLKAYVTGDGHNLLIPEDDSVAYVERVLATLKDAVQALDSGTLVQMLKHRPV